MRKRWKVVGGTGVASICAIAILVGHSSFVQGDTAIDSPTTSSAPTSGATALPKRVFKPGGSFVVDFGIRPKRKLSFIDVLPCPVLIV